MDILSLSITNYDNENRWIPLRAGSKGPKISHSIFSDDLILFAEASRNQMEVILNCLNQRNFIWGSEPSHR